MKGLQFYSHHGYYKEEQVLGGQYIVDVYLDMDLEEAEKSDKLSETLNYEEVYKIISTEMEIPSNLIEHVAKRILDKIMASYKDLLYVRVRFIKIEPSIKRNRRQSVC